jgi:hypothetical protein
MAYDRYMSTRDSRYSAPGAYGRGRKVADMDSMEYGTVVVRVAGRDVVREATRDARGYVSMDSERGRVRATHDTRATFLPLVQRADVIRRIGHTTVRMSWDVRGNVTVRVTVGDEVATFASLEDAAYVIAYVLIADGGEADFVVGVNVARLFAGDDMDAALDAATNGAMDAAVSDAPMPTLADITAMLEASR